MGSIKPAVIATWSFGLKAAEAGMKALRAGGSALDAVEEAVKTVENDPANRSVGLGGYPNMLGDVELDASIMDGSTLRAGAVAAVKNVKNPISLARKVMELTPHVMLVGEGAYMFARLMGLEHHAPLQPEVKKAWREYLDQVKHSSPGKGTLDFWAKYIHEMKAHDTIGVVAIDKSGNIAAGCSTSGLAFKMPGRVGDSPIIGAGIYADSLAGGASATGLGENIMRFCTTRIVVEYMYRGLSAQEAAETAMRFILSRDRFARNIAVVALDAKGRAGASTTDEKFEYAFMTADMEEPELRSVKGVSI
ncbi:MAG: N(4)-(beta-N-acetylglucosaminyl)-L-asparaginase [Candidatus Bathyarchaeota archaeon]|nr:N(4)-(beta-N-acetylglucosaminyl)-L-asparaginase [Candidatus Bathyarchaeota archaeon]